jgi:hypothetical protein
VKENYQVQKCKGILKKSEKNFIQVEPSESWQKKFSLGLKTMIRELILIEYLKFSMNYPLIFNIRLAILW